MKIIAALLLLSSAYCVASVTNTTTAAGSACPVVFTHSRFYHRPNHDDSPVTLDYTNPGQLKVIGIKITVSTMDPTGDFDSLGDLTSAESLKPGEHSHFGSWNPIVMHGYAGYRVTLKKVSFSDGTTWENDGKDSCSWTEDYRTK